MENEKKKKIFDFVIKIVDNDIENYAPPCYIVTVYIMKGDNHP